MAAAVNSIRRYLYTGEDGEVIPADATHISAAVKVIPARAFEYHPCIVEVFCDKKVERIEEEAFGGCPSLRRVIMPGVKFIGVEAFVQCETLTDVECDKVEIIENGAFYNCKSLRSTTFHQPGSLRMVHSWIAKLWWM